ncbi:MAG: bifunctional pyr operon transcriptional regulator/uracil phosphoribosyltransferase PyrR [Fimbriimonadaceae bacterium]|nr:bifunctional pyr operon transcriptional regulator/uracil phosphoribosyltransferase PyrR [Fimbriimonadaceae bacterium]
MGTLVLDAVGMKRTLGRMAHEILEANSGSEGLVVVGVLRRGYPLAKRLAFAMTQIEGTTVPCGKLDVTASRDDDRLAVGDDTEIPFAITDRIVILVDEVVFTGRTVRAALDALLAQGRPAAVRLAVLVDRGHRELPIQPDFVGRTVETGLEERVIVKFHEFDGEDSVLLESGAQAVRG